jgi:KUP system potassium uptake protein
MISRRATRIDGNGDYTGAFVSDTSTSAPQAADSTHRHPDRALLPLTVTALGVVYGDIGTSPLYAIRECFFGSHAVPPTHDNVLGVLSLIIYALLFVISIKYIAIVMRADNQGEGGILSARRSCTGTA